VKIKKSLLLIILISLNIFIYSKERIAVLDFSAIDLKKSIADTIREIIVTTIADYGIYELVERSQIDKLIGELNMTGSEDFEDETVIEIGKLAKAKIVLAGVVSKLGSKYIINVRGIEVDSGKILFGKNISCNSEDDIFETSKAIAGLICGDDKAFKLIENKNNSDNFYLADYKYIDTFDTLNQNAWVKIDNNKEITIDTRNGYLVFSGKYREGRLNSINSVTTKDFRVGSLTVEVSFRDKLKSSDSIRLSIGNSNWYTGSIVTVGVNLKKEYYYFSWNYGTEWFNHDDAILYTFGDEDVKFHKLKIVYDFDNKIAYAYIDDKLLDKIIDFKFDLKDKINISLNVNESVSRIKKDFYVEFDDFKCTVDLK